MQSRPVPVSRETGSGPPADFADEEKNFPQVFHVKHATLGPVPGTSGPRDIVGGSRTPCQSP